MAKRSMTIGGLCMFLTMVCFCSTVFAQAPEAGKETASLIARIVMGFSLSLGLAGSAIGLGIAFSALLGGGQENFFKNIAVNL